VFAWLKVNLLWPLYEAYNRWSANDGSQLAAAVAYYMALSFFPLMLILLAAGGLLFRFTGWGRDTQAELLELISDQIAPSVAEQVAALLRSVELSAPVGGPLGMIALLLASIAIFGQFERAFDRIWRVPEPDSFSFVATVREILLYRLRAFLMLLGVGFLLAAAFVVTMGLAAIETASQQWLPLPAGVWTLVTLLAAVTINWTLFSIIYKVLPRAHVPWGAAMRGGLLAAVVWEIGRRVLAALVIGSRYDVYGVVGAFIAIMLWVYYAATSIFFGAEFVRALSVPPASPPADKHG
jgi:YihY family inner membrane protein